MHYSHQPFRVWSIKDQAFIEDCLLGSEGNLFKDGKILGISDYRISLATTYSDVSDKVIYSGDILKFHFETEDGDEEEDEINWIDFNEDGFVLKSVLNSDVYDCISNVLDHEDASYVEVVGNIWENPELFN